MDLKRELKTKSQHFVPCSYLYGFAAQKNIENLVKVEFIVIP